MLKENSAMIFGTFLLRVSIWISSKSISQIFKILFLSGDINIFVLRGVFSVQHSQIKSSFSMEKTPMVETDTYFGQEAVKG